mmetsp:Transcript_103501/g.297383  ORF Transcript_103501/g.297383 Transcript_103501/m.297383 type:complete len:166 (-) Transcript_103501:349-846(-)
MAGRLIRPVLASTPRVLLGARMTARPSRASSSSALAQMTARRSMASSSSSMVPSPSTSNAPTIPIEFDKAAKIEGGDSQIVTVDILPGQALRAESGNLIYMSDGVEMETSATGGMSAGFARYMAGGSIFLSSFRYTGEVGKGSVALGTDMPSKIMKMTVKDYEGG